MASVYVFHFILEHIGSTDLCTSVKCCCFDSIDNVSDRMWNPVRNKCSWAFLITVSLSVGDAVLPDIAIKNTNKNLKINQNYFKSNKII